MFRIMIIIFLFASTCFSQTNNATKQSNIKEANEIIHKAHQAIGFDKSGEISSCFYKVSRKLLMKDSTNESSEEVSFGLPSKIQIIYGNEAPFFSRLTRTWNSEKYKSILESEYDGRRNIQDMTELEKNELSKNLSNVLGKKSKVALQGSQKADPKSIFKESLWTSLFPLILSHPFEKNIEFNFVGKAKSNDKIANVIDVKPSNGNSYRLLFDSETNYLMMMIVSFKVKNEMFVGDVETKYYFSQRELINGLLIPKKIKVEDKATPLGQAPTIKFSTIEILDFKINPKIDEKIFEIK